jgi:hypothetical protein
VLYIYVSKKLCLFIFLHVPAILCKQHKNGRVGKTEDGTTVVFKFATKDIIKNKTTKKEQQQKPHAQKHDITKKSHLQNGNVRM